MSDVSSETVHSETKQLSNKVASDNHASVEAVPVDTPQVTSTTPPSVVYNAKGVESDKLPDVTSEDLVTCDEKVDFEETPPPPYSIYTRNQKWAILFMISMAGLFSPLSANIYFPAIPNIAADLHTTTEKVNLTVTVYMIFQAISPTFWAAVCDVLGRRPVYYGTFTVYIGACIGLANTHEYWLLVVLRCLQAFGSASLIAAGAGTTADIATVAERGGYMGAFGIGSMLGPCIGPLIGGFITEAWYWQALFAFLAAFSAIPFFLIIFFLPETLRSLVGNGSVKPPHFLNRPICNTLLPKDAQMQSADNSELTPKTWRDIDPWAPFRPFRELDVIMLMFFNSICYALFYCVTASTSSVFKETYKLSESQIGLCFIAFGAGCVISSISNGWRMDTDFRIVSRQFFRDRGGDEATIDAATPAELKAMLLNITDGLAEFPIEKARLRSIFVFVFGLIASTIVYGWTVWAHVHLSVPLICQFIIGVTSTSVSNIMSTLLLDLNPKGSASVTAANNLCRCSMGAVGTAVISLILDRLDAGWTFTMLSLITLASTPILVIEYTRGMAIRGKRLERLERRAAATKRT